EVVEVMVRAVPDLGEDARLRGSAVDTLQDTTLDFAGAFNGRFDDDFRVVALGFLNRLGQLVRLVDLADADAGATAGGLHEHRVAHRRDGLLAGAPIPGPLPRPEHGKRRDRQPVRPEHQVGVVLVHRGCAAEHPGADIPYAGELEHALDRAVLAEWAVEEREDNIDLAEGGRDLAGFVGDQLAPLVAADQDDRAAFFVDLGKPAALD